jgi:hypothetical protein
MLHEFLVGGRCPSQQLRLAPHVIMKSNLSFFLDRLSMESDEISDPNTLNPAPPARKVPKVSS